MKIKIFAVSDVHGHATLLQKALEEAGFDRNNSDHLFVGCGDYFDRGTENREVYDFLESLPHKVLVRGNHEDLLMSALNRGKLGAHDIHNFTDVTIEQFLGNDSISLDGTIAKGRRWEKRLRDFVDSTVDYFETEHFVFVHGWIPLDRELKIGDFRRGTPAEWKDARFREWMSMYRAGLTLHDKTIVCGHRNVAHAHVFDMRRRPTDSKPFYGERMIAIDALTVVSGRVNVLVLEDELLPETEHRMDLFGTQFEEMLYDRKHIEMRLCDSKREAVKPGDTIVFRKATDLGKTLRAKVYGVHKYENFEDLVHDYKPRNLGFSGRAKSSICSKMNYLYGKDRIQKNGVLAIRVRVIDEDTSNESNIS